MIKLDQYIMHSGGAEGADSVWDAIAERYGILDRRHYWHGRKTPKGNICLTDAECSEGWKHVLKANDTLKRKPWKYRSLLSRNWFQVQNSEAVFAVGQIKGSLCEGGTGWAVQMAIDNNIPVYLLEKNTIIWHYWDAKYKMFSPCNETPILTRNFAGIGSREISVLCAKAMMDVFDATIRQINAKISA